MKTGDGQTYIFDYGGTLDTGGCHWGILLCDLCRQQGVPASDERLREAYVYGERMLGSGQIVKPTDTFRQTLQAKLHIALGHAGCEEYADAVADAAYRQALAHTAHSRRVLSVLKERHRLALVSNFYGNLATVLHEFSLDNLFTTVVESAAVGVRKPSPEIFMHAIRELHCQPSEVTIVGDSLKNDIAPGLQLGCRTVWLKGRQWGDAGTDCCRPALTIGDLEELVENGKMSK